MADPGPGGKFVLGGIVIDTTKIDFNDRRSRKADVYIANITLIALIGVFVTLRFAVRAFLIRRFFADDAFVLLAALFTIAFSCVCIVSTTHGIGTHVWLLPPLEVLSKLKKCVQYLFVCQILYACATALTKFSIISSYLRFINDRTFRRIMFVAATLISIMWVLGVFLTIFQCRPVNAAWDFTITSGKCIKYINFLYASSAFNIVTDLMLCIVPWPYLWRLQLPRKQRIILCALLGIGAGAFIACSVRTAQVHLLITMDVTFDSVPGLNLSVVECAVGIICVSIPALRPLAVRAMPRSLGAGGHTSSAGYSRTNDFADKPSFRQRDMTVGSYYHAKTETSERDMELQEFEQTGRAGIIIEHPRPVRTIGPA